MPGFDGTGPLGQGPMTGRGQGFCVLTNSEENSVQVKGIAGLQNVPVEQVNENYENCGKDGYYAKRRWYRTWRSRTRNRTWYGTGPGPGPG